MSADDVTVGELFRALGKVEKAVDDGFTKVNQRIDHLRSEFVLKELYESERDDITRRLDDTLSARRWWATTSVAVLAGLASVAQYVIHLH